jgi:hypothetical protein
MEKQNNFESLRLYVGIDVHKKQWSVSIFTDAAHHRTFSQPASAEALKSYLDNHFPNASVSCAMRRPNWAIGSTESSLILAMHAW